MDVGIVISTLNSEPLLEDCLFSIYKNTIRAKFEIIVIDNASTDNSIKMLEKNFPDVRIIRNRKNKGVAPSRNQGLKNITARYVLILDADTTIEKEAIDKMVEFMDDNPQIGICGAKLISPSGELQLTCRRFHNILIPFLRRLTFLNFVKSSRQLRNFLMEDWDHTSPRKVDHVIGACQLIRKEVTDQIGILDNRMFYGWEDTDFCIRSKRAGYETWYYPYATIIHHEQRITKRKIFSKLLFENFKSMVTFFRKYPSGLIGKY